MQKLRSFCFSRSAHENGGCVHILKEHQTTVWGCGSLSSATLSGNVGKAYSYVDTSLKTYSWKKFRRPFVVL